MRHRFVVHRNSIAILICLSTGSALAAPECPEVARDKTRPKEWIYAAVVGTPGSAAPLASAALEYSFRGGGRRLSSLPTGPGCFAIDVGGNSAVRLHCGPPLGWQPQFYDLSSSQWERHRRGKAAFACAVRPSEVLNTYRKSADGPLLKYEEVAESKRRDYVRDVVRVASSNNDSRWLDQAVSDLSIPAGLVSREALRSIPGNEGCDSGCLARLSSNRAVDKTVKVWLENHREDLVQRESSERAQAADALRRQLASMPANHVDRDTYSKIIQLMGEKQLQFNECNKARFPDAYKNLGLGTPVQARRACSVAAEYIKATELSIP